MSDPNEPPCHGADADHNDGQNSPARDRRWLGIQFECCNVYARIHKNKAGTAYVGWCPHCCRTVRVRVGADGTSSRFFRAH